MKSPFLIGAWLWILTSVNPLLLVGQDVHPIQGQPQGGDRRGTYYLSDEEALKEYDETGGVTHLYQDPKLYLHNATVLAHVPGSFFVADMMTIGSNRYLVSGGVVVDVSNPKQPVIINHKAPGGEVAYNQALRKWIVMRADGCCISRQAWVQGKAPHPEADPQRGGVRLGTTFFDFTD